MDNRTLFTQEELLILSNGILALLNNAYEAKKLVYGDDIQSAIDGKIEMLVALNNKVCQWTEEDPKTNMGKKTGFNKEEFLQSQMGYEIKDCITSWDKALENYKKFPYCSEEYKREKRVMDWCQAQWEAYKLAIYEFYGVEYCFTRTEEYYGVVTEDNENWLFKIYK